MPPIAKLTNLQAAYYFLSGYTALVGSTEVGGGNDIKPAFSTCFGAPFFPRQPVTYAKLLMKRLEETGAKVYLLNTGWNGGGYGVGERFSIATSRELVRQAVDGRVAQAPSTTLPGFNFAIPTQLDNIESHILDPRLNWNDSNQSYPEVSKILRQQFIDNFKQFKVDDEIISAGPHNLAIDD